MIAVLGRRSSFWLTLRSNLPVAMDFLAVSSYGAGTTSSGVVRISQGRPSEPVEGRNGSSWRTSSTPVRTLDYLLRMLRQRHPGHAASSARCWTNASGARSMFPRLRGVQFLMSSSSATSRIFPPSITGNCPSSAC